ncbi:MAG: FAD-dependent oxidoreductase [Chloroflexi bacterium]|nr:FAD-dependent oxidoreductase [Chloroflexota bacterium]
MNYVIVGNGIAGLTAAETLRALDTRSKITIISAEPEVTYSRAMLPYLLSGTADEEDLYLRSPGHCAALDIQLIRGCKATRIDVGGRRVELDRGDDLYYDRLLLATGSAAVLPPLPGVEAQGVFGLRSMADATGLMRASEGAQSAVVIGGGLIGLLAAEALHKRGLKVAVVESATHLLIQQLDSLSAELFRQEFERRGVQVCTGATVKQIATENCNGKAAVEGVVLHSNQVLPCRLVVLAVGVRPNIGLAAGAELAVGRGILVNDLLETSAPGVFGAGDVAEAYDLGLRRPAVSGIWPLAVSQGRFAGHNMAGQTRRYPGGLTAQNAFDFFQIPAVSAGQVQINDSGYETITTFRARERVYRKLILKDDRIVGMVFVGDISGAGVIVTLIREGRPVRAMKDRLLKDDFSYGDLLPLNRLTAGEPLELGQTV